MSDDDRLADLTAAYLEHVEQDAPVPNLDGLDGEDRREAVVHLQLLDALWGADNYDVPVLREDPVAIRFGFDRVSPTMRVAGPRLRRCRTDLGPRVSDVVARLVEMGHDINQQELATIERAPARTVPLALATALAVVLEVAIADFEAPAAPRGARLLADDFVADGLFAATVSSWAAAHGRDARPVADRARERLLSVRHRGDQELTREQWRDLLLDFLDAAT